VIPELLALLESLTDITQSPNQPKSHSEVEKYSITLWGLPTDIPKDYQESILARIAEHIDTQHDGAVFMPKQLIETQFFTLEIGKAVYRIRYEVRARQFITALKTFKSAVNWMQESDLDPEVKLITQTYLLRELQKEYRTVVPRHSLQSDNIVLVPSISPADKSDIPSSAVTSELEGAENDKKRRAFPDQV
jgi:hypothetical protein